MELQELKEIWNEYDRKLDKSLKLNMQLLRKMNFDKIERKTKTIFVYKLIEMAIFMFMMVYLYRFGAQYFTTPQFSISGFVIAAFITAGLISDVRQVVILIQLRTNYAAPIAPIQKKLEKLKLLIINYVKCSLLSIPFFPLLTLLAGKIMFDVDFWELKRRTYFITNVGCGLLLLPLFIWLFVQLSKNNTQQRWVKNFLAGSGWNQANAAQSFLREIENFEKED